MNKIKFEILSLEVEKLYLKEFEDKDVSGINEHCEFIADFINAAGWTEEEYIRRMFDFDKNVN